MQRVRQDWKPEEQELVQRLARRIVDRGMALPATLFLESVRPLHFVGGNALHFLAPMAGLVVPRWELDRLGSFLEQRDAVPYLIDTIERLERERDAASRAAKRARRAQRTSAARGNVWRFWRRTKPAAPDTAPPPSDAPGPGVSR
jgi:hypothetical protein